MSSSWVRGDPSALLRRLARFDVLALVATIWFLAKFLRYAFPPLFGTLQDAYGVSTAVVGTAFSGLMLVYALAQFPSGTLADRLGAVRVIAGGAVVAAAGALSLAVEAPFVVLVAGMLLVGLGTGAHKTVAIRLMARVYPARTGRALGAMDTVGAFGGVVAFLPLYLVDAAGLAPATASLLYSGLFALTLVQLGTGELADRVGEGPVLVATLTVAAAGLAGLLSLDALGLSAIALSVGALGLGSHGFRPVRGAYLVRVIPEEVAGGTLGLVRTGLMIAGAVAPGVVGGLVEFVGYRAAFLPLFAALAGAALVAAGLALTGA